MNKKIILPDLGQYCLIFGNIVLSTLGAMLDTGRGTLGLTVDKLLRTSTEKLVDVCALSSIIIFWGFVVIYWL